MRLGRRDFNLLAALLTIPGINRASPATSPVEVSTQLSLMARQLFPHAAVDDAHYTRIASAFVDTSEVQAQRLADALIAADFAALAAPERVDKLRAMQASADFQTYRMHVLIQLYSDHGVTERFGYEGPSLEHGGYLTRGFDDIDWLPENS